MIDQTQIDREMLAFGEKIALAKLEVTKAQERVAAIEYDQARYQLEVFLAIQKQRQQAGITGIQGECK